MIYYVWNSNKPLPQDLASKVLVHRCDHCNLFLVGEYIDDAKDFNVSENELYNFITMPKCPFCGKEFLEDRNHHFTLESRNISFIRHSYDMYLSSLKRISKKTKIADAFLDFWLPYRHFPRTTRVPLKNPLIKKGDTITCEVDDGIVSVVQTGTVDIISVDKLAYVNFFENDTASFLDYLENLSFIRDSYEIETDNKLNAFISECIQKNDSSPSATISNKESFDLKKYLSHIVTTEKNIFATSKRLRELYYLNCSLEREAPISANILIASQKNELEKKLQESLARCRKLESRIVEKEIFIYNFPVKQIKKPIEPKQPSPFTPPTKPQFPALKRPNIFNKKRVLEENAVLTRCYEEKMAEYETILQNQKAEFDAKVNAYETNLENYKIKLAEYNAETEKQRNLEYQEALKQAKEKLAKKIAEERNRYNNISAKLKELTESANTLPTMQKTAYFLIADEIKSAEELLQALYNTLHKLYSYNIIFDKYRNLVAVSSFCEYLETGRCEALEGPNGAYNLYESEIRMNTIISQLDQVVESLETVKNNQFILYTSIQETNKQLSIIGSTMSKMLDSVNSIRISAQNMEGHMSQIAKNTSVIAYNTERTAFYSKKNAELTNALGFMLALK